MIDSILQRISSYNIFNYLLPGIVYVAFLEVISSYSLYQENIVIGLFLYYFLGMVISRIGSLIIEPLLKKLRIIKFAPYSNYVKASKQDKKIELLSEVNNTYRTIISLFLILLMTLLFEHIFQFFSISDRGISIIIIVGILILFILSYRKQTIYITERIDSNLNDGIN